MKTVHIQVIVYEKPDSIVIFVMKNNYNRFVSSA